MARSTRKTSFTGQGAAGDFNSDKKEAANNSQLSKLSHTLHFPLKKLVNQWFLNGLAQQFAIIVYELQADDIGSDHQIKNPAKQKLLLDWIDKAVKESVKCLLDEHGYLKAKVAFNLGWANDHTLYRPENIQAITFSFLRSFLERMIEAAFADEQKLPPFLSAAKQFVHDVALEQLQKNILIKPLRCNDFSKCIHKEFATIPIKRRKVEDYTVLIKLIKELPEMKKIPEDKLIVVLSNASSQPQVSEVFFKILQKYYALACFLLGKKR